MQCWGPNLGLHERQPSTIPMSPIPSSSGIRAIADPCCRNSGVEWKGSVQMALLQLLRVPGQVLTDTDVPNSVLGPVFPYSFPNFKQRLYSRLLEIHELSTFLSYSLRLSFNTYG